MMRALRPATEMSASSAAASPAPTAGALDGGDDRLAAIDDVVNEVARLFPDARAPGPITCHRVDHIEIATG